MLPFYLERSGNDLSGLKPFHSIHDEVSQPMESGLLSKNIGHLAEVDEIANQTD